MKIEDQVCSFDLSKRLKELGVKQESYFYWTDFGSPILVSAKESPAIDPEHKYSAFMVSELHQLLPTQEEANALANQLISTLKNDLV